MLTQTYHGAAEEGVGGAVKGFGKGVIGTVTKPAAGVLDLASGTLNALKSTTDNENRMRNRQRPPRCGVKAGAGLSHYSSHDAKGSNYVLKLESASPGERYYALETVRHSNGDGLLALITNKGSHFLPLWNPERPVLQVKHEELIHARHGMSDGKYIIELTKMGNESGISSASAPNRDRPKVVCDNEKIARKVSQQINYAKSCFEELKQEVVSSTSDIDLTLVLDETSER